MFSNFSFAVAISHSESNLSFFLSFNSSLFFPVVSFNPCLWLSYLSQIYLTVVQRSLLTRSSTLMGSLPVPAAVWWWKLTFAHRNSIMFSVLPFGFCKFLLHLYPHGGLKQPQASFLWSSHHQRTCCSYLFDILSSKKTRKYSYFSSFFLFLYP